MTSLSHDVKAPLSSLFGNLDAIENGIVTGDEKDTYLHIAVEKTFEVCDLNELTRNIAADWVPVLEQHHFEFDFDIPEDEYPFHIGV